MAPRISRKYRAWLPERGRVLPFPNASIQQVRIMSRDPDDVAVEWDIRGRFISRGPGARLAELAVEAWRSAPEEDREAVLDRVRAAATYADRQYYDNAYYRDRTMDGWFQMDGLTFDEIARLGGEMIAHWQAEEAARLPSPDDEEAWERLEAEEAKREAEEDRVRHLEDEGFYGRTLRYQPDFERYIYVRFGRMPKDGYSHFGLAGEDTEDGPDPWRLETGGKWRESGTSVFRAYHHPEHPGHFVLVSPHYDMAMYGVDALDGHLLAVVPEGDPTILRVDGSPVTCKGRDGTVRVELGSDGEYLIDPRTITAVEELAPDRIWVSEGGRLEDLLARRSSHGMPL